MEIKLWILEKLDLYGNVSLPPELDKVPLDELAERLTEECGYEVRVRDAYCFRDTRFDTEGSMRTTYDKYRIAEQVKKGRKN